MTCVGLKSSKDQKEICHVLKAQGNVTCKSNLTSKTCCFAIILILGIPNNRYGSYFNE